MHLFQADSTLTLCLREGVVECDHPTYRPSQPPLLIHHRLNEDGQGYLLVKLPGQDHTGLSGGKRVYIGTTFFILKVAEFEEDTFRVKEVLDMKAYGRKWGMVLEMQERLNREFEGDSDAV